MKTSLLSSFSIPALFLLVFHCSGFAQNTDWKDITLVTKNNDTIQGSIAYTNKFKSYKVLSVKAKGEAASKLYHTEDVKSFTVKTDEGTLLFQTLIVDAEYSPTEMIKLGISPKVELTRDTVFAQILLKGTRSMYHYIDSKVYKEHFLIQTEEGQLTDLVNKQYLAKGNIIAYNNEYKRQLLLLLASPSIPASRITNTAFKRKPILSLVKDYNKAVSSTPSTYEYKEEKAEFKFGLTAGCNLTRLNFYGDNTYLAQLKFNSSVGVNAGAFLNIIIQGTHKRWSIYNEVLYSSYHVQTTNSIYLYYENDTWYRSITNATVDVSILKLYTAARYQLPASRFAPYFQFGFANGYLFNHSADINYETRFLSEMYTEKTPMEFRKYEQSLFAGLGGKYRKVGLELRYEVGNGFSRGSGIASIMNYGYLLLNYTF